MKSYQVDILNPKALTLLRNLADLKFISLKKKEDHLQSVLKKLRKKDSINPPSLEEITKEVEFIRAKRNVRLKR